MKTLNSTVSLGTANRWRVLNADPIETFGLMRIIVQLINNGNSLVSQIEVGVRNGECDVVAIDTGAVDLSRALVITGRVTLATGYTDAFAAIRAAANTMSARRDALETWMLANGVAAANMAGT